MARFAIALDLHRSPSLQQFYTYHWSPVGNLGLDILVRILAPLIGVEPATKCVVLAIPPLTAAAFLWIAHEVHGRIPPTAYFALPFAYGQPFLYGFANFALSAALAFLAFALWLRLGRLQRLKLRAILFVPISLMVFFAHAYGWGMLGLMCTSAEVVVQHRRVGRWDRALFNAFVEVLSLAPPLLVMIAWRANASGAWAWAWFQWLAKLLWVESALRDRWQWLDFASVAIAVLVIFLGGRQWKFAPALLVPGVAFGAIFLLLPETLFQSTFADMRLVPYTFALLLLGLRVAPASARNASLVAALALAFVLMRLTANTISLSEASEDQQSKSLAIARLPVGARVATFVGIACEGRWALARNIHLGSLVAIRRHGFSNDQWLNGASGLGLKYRAAGYFAADPSQIVIPSGCNDGLHRTIDQALSGFPRSAFDYVWLIDAPAFEPKFARGLSLVWQGAGTKLYRIVQSDQIPRVQSHR
jgi:hypothetical protein